MRILIPGASGLLGANLALGLAEDHTLFGVVNRTRLQTAKFQVLQADLLEPGALERLFEQARPDWVINCAALADLERCEQQPELARRINSELPALLAERCRMGGARLLHVSTDAVFDGRTGGYSEQDPPNPLNVYAQTKLSGEQLALAANPETLIARVNLFGFSLNGRRSLAEFFLYGLQAGQPLHGFTDMVFCPILINELGPIFSAMLKRGLAGLFHVFSADCLSKYEFAVRIARRFGLDPGLITPVSASAAGLRVARAPNLSMDTRKLSTALGMETPSFTLMLDRFYTLYQQGYPQRLAEMIR